MKRMIGYAKIVVLMVASASLMVACGNKGSDDITSLPPGYGMFGGSCQAGSCPMYPAPLTNALASGYGMNFNFNLIGDQQAVAAAQYQGYYSGPIAVGGTVTVSTPIQAGYCVIQPGQYQVSTLQGASVTSAGMIGTLGIRISGPGVYDMVWSNTYYLTSSGRLSADVTVVSGSGYGMGGMVQCGGYPMLF